MIYHIVIVFLLSIQLYCKIIIPIDNEIKGKILSIDTNTSISIQFSSLLSKTFLSSFINKTDLPIYEEIHNSTFTFDEPNLFTNSSFTFDLSYYALINENVSSFKYGSIGIDKPVDNSIPLRANFINSLYDDHILKYKIVSIIQSSKSYLLLGDFSKGTIFTQYYPQMKYCLSKHTWSCDIQSVIIDNNKYDFSSFFKVDTTIDSLIIPQSVFTIIFKNSLNDYNCNLTTSNQFICYKTSNILKMKFAFNVNNNRFNFNFTNLLQEKDKDNNKIFDIYVNSDPDIDYWILGRRCFKDSFISYDLDTQRLGFIHQFKYNTIINDIVVTEATIEHTTKIGWMITLIIILGFVYALVNYVSEGKILFRKKKDSLDLLDDNDVNKVMNIKKEFAKEIEPLSQKIEMKETK